MANLQNKMREQLAQAFVDSLSKGQLPWKACWKTRLPENATSGKKYNGINALFLSFMEASAGFTDNRWCTFKQAQDKGWHIIKGSKGTPIEYWSPYDAGKKKMITWKDAAKLKQEDPEYAEKNLQLRSKVYTVFNGCQVEGIPEQEKNSDDALNTVIAHRDTLLANMGLDLVEGGSDCYYNPVEDAVHLPAASDFFDSYSYACSLLHECGHATGHSSRLNRNIENSFGTEDYAKEELRAEIASAFASQALGLRMTDEQLKQHMELHEAYVQSWAKAIADAPQELFKAIKDAEKIADYLIEKGEFNSSPSDEEKAA